MLFSVQKGREFLIARDEVDEDEWIFGLRQMIKKTTNAEKGTLGVSGLTRERKREYLRSGGWGQHKTYSGEICSVA